MVQDVDDDNTCLKCPARGLCCYPSYVLKGKQLADMSDPCEFLDVKTGLCTIYKERHTKEERTGYPCLTVDQMLEAATVPVSCLYVKDKAAYRKLPYRRHYNFKIVLND